MKKSLIFKILYLFLVLIVVAGASVFATNTYLASQVSYGNSNVEDALNGLFTLKGNDENYSTDEKVVGKWIDGKPIYRKLFNVGSFTVDTTNKNVVVGTMTDVDRAISCYGNAKWGNHYLNLPYNYAAASNLITVICRYNSVNGNIEINSERAAGSTTATECFIVLEYTKTTD